MRPPSPLACLFFVACATTAAGCGKPGMGPVVAFNGDPAAGPVSDELASSRLFSTTDATGATVNLSWETAPWSDGDPMTAAWLPYQPHTQLHITHPLGRVPVGVLVYISFVEEGSTPAMAAGDLARVVEMTDEVVTVWNDTNGIYYARVVVF